MIQFLLFSTAFVAAAHAYKAAVVEYAPIGIYGPSSAIDIIRQNLAEYEKIVESLKAIDIIIFPEYGITTLQVPSNRTRAKEFLQAVPEPSNETICTGVLPNEPSYETVHRLSCIALRGSTYLVANLGEIRNCSESDANCPSDGAYHFNVNVVFDRAGRLIAKYRKSNMYGELAMDRPTETDLTTFTTDFDIEFGVIICFDMMYRKPTIDLYEKLGIRNFIVSTAWVDELPFLTAPQIQSGLARGLNISVLVSGYHQPRGGQLGSGIFFENVSQNYIFNVTSGTQVLVSEIDGSGRRPSVSVRAPLKATHDGHYILHEDLSRYSHMTVDLSSTTAALCHNGTCCSVTYNSIPTSSVTYKLLAYNGIRYVGGGIYPLYIETCAFVACRDESIESCGLLDVGVADFDMIELQGNFSSSYPLPSLINADLLLYDPQYISFSREADTFYLRNSKTLEKLLTYSLYARQYDVVR